MCPWKFLTLRTVEATVLPFYKAFCQSQRSHPNRYLDCLQSEISWVLFIKVAYCRKVLGIFNFVPSIKVCARSLVLNFSLFFANGTKLKSISFYRTIVRPTNARSYDGKKIKWPRLWSWKKGLVRRQQSRGHSFSRARLSIVPSHNLPSYHCTLIQRKDVFCQLWLWKKKALYNGNSAQGQPFSRAPSYTIFKGHRFEGRHWRRQRWRSRWLSSTQGRPPTPPPTPTPPLPPPPLPHHRQWLFWPFSFVLAHGKKIIAYIIQGHCYIATTKKESLLSIVAS